MKFVKIIAASLLAAASLCAFYSCDDDDDPVAKAVLASASSLSFDVSGADAQMITIYSDAQWHLVSCPDWMIISPETGSGVTDVTIAVSDNLASDGEPDNPRTVTLVFKGSTIASEASVAVSQDGDKYRGLQDYTVDEIGSLADGAVVSVPEALVVALSTAGFMVTDVSSTSTTSIGTKAGSGASVFISSSIDVEVGDIISLKGDKGTTYSLPAIVSDDDELEVVSSGNTVALSDPVDITDQIDTYSSTSWDYVTVYGVLTGTYITVDGATYSVSIVETPESLGVSSLSGHYVTLTGYYAGTASPYLRILGTDIEDHGAYVTYYFQEDFEWLDNWSNASLSGLTTGDAGQTIEYNNLDAYCPQIGTPKIDGVSARDTLLLRGYQFLRVTPSGETTSECIYLQRNYLKFGKTGYQAGIVLPPISGIPSGTDLKMTFDWCPMRQGSGTIDPVNLTVSFVTGIEETTFDIPECGWESGHALEWIAAEIDLAGVTITEDTVITIKATQWGVSTANRWFIDNIMIYAER